MEQTTLSKYVKAMRKQYNLTQVELSEKSGVEWHSWILPI